MNRHRTTDSVDLKCFWKWQHHRKKNNHSWVQDLKTILGNNKFSSVPSLGYLRDKIWAKGCGLAPHLDTSTVKARVHR